MTATGSPHQVWSDAAGQDHLLDRIHSYGCILGQFPTPKIGTRGLFAVIRTGLSVAWESFG